MAKLTETDREELRRLAKAPREKEPAAERMTPRNYIESAMFASRFSRAETQVRFDGKSWRL